MRGRALKIMLGSRRALLLFEDGDLGFMWRFRFMAKTL